MPSIQEILAIKREVNGGVRIGIGCVAPPANSLVVVSGIYPGNQTTRYISDDSTQTTISAGLLVGGPVRELNDSKNIAATTTDTLFAVAASSAWLIWITQGTESYGASGFVHVPEGSATAELYNFASTHANLQLAVSGLNVQAYNGVGNTRTVKWRALRIN